MFDRIDQGVYWDRAWTLVSGCTPCSPGCTHCWALAMERRFHFKGCNGCSEDIHEIKTHPERLDIPLKRKKPTVYALWNDFFHEDVPTRFIDRAFEVMAACPQHIFLVLTKRARLLNEKIYGVTEENGCRELGGGDFNPNVWLGVTVCNQAEADEKIPLLLQIQAAVRWVSIEPMLGPINITDQPWWDWRYTYGFYPRDFARKPIDWVVLGGETGPGTRPMHPDWVRSVRDQCQEAGIPLFFKGWGSKPPLEFRKKNIGRLLDGREWNGLPEIK